MTDEQLKRAEEIKSEIRRLPELKVNGYGKVPTLLSERDAIKVLHLMFPTAGHSTSTSDTTYIHFSEANALNIAGIIEAKRKQLQKEFDSL